jgi:hypothetical protein
MKMHLVAYLLLCPVCMYVYLLKWVKCDVDKLLFVLFLRRHASQEPNVRHTAQGCDRHTAQGRPQFSKVCYSYHFRVIAVLHNPTNVIGKSQRVGLLLPASQSCLAHELQYLIYQMQRQRELFHKQILSNQSWIHFKYFKTLSFFF